MNSLDVEPHISSDQNVHHQLEFYLVALAFTTFAFATQTGEFSGFIIGDATEALSWILLVLSGIVGLMRLEYLPVAYRVHDYIQVRRQSIREYQNDEEYRDDVEALKTQVAENEPALMEIEAKNQNRYRWQMRFLVAGFGMLLVARVIAQAVKHY